MASPGIDMTQIFGPFYWGVVVALLLSGITILQAYIYFPSSRDKHSVQIVAGSMLVLDMVSSALIVQSLYYYLVPHFGSLAPLDSVTPELSAECLISTIITFISQMYFVYQIYTVKNLGGRNWIVISTISLCAFLAFVGGVGCVGSMYKFHHGVLSHRNDVFSIFFGLAKGFGALTDIIATTAMCFYLSESRTGIRETNSLIKSLMKFVVHRGALVTLIQTLLLITFYASPLNIYWIAFHVNVTKLYANTFFAMLNGREHILNKHGPRKGSKALSFSTSSIGTSHHHSRIDEQAFHSRSTEHHPGLEMPTISKSVVIADI
ncbi:hypothetical protein VKT23_013361 [Stygiomarasmius scandens]|uniref:DUF6534 domain-containing protein n=1 Tax=Marasmiellus scandens TaxID=2682957 RepID=A0ABR1J381_9AGAR